MRYDRYEQHNKIHMTYKVVIDQDTLKQIKEYQQAGFYGSRMREALAGQDGKSLSTEEFIKALLDSKKPVIMAESGDISGWTDQEKLILGRINITAEVNIYADGKWQKQQKQHDKPFKGELLFTPGILLARDNPDKSLVVKDRKINQEAYTVEVRQRILPLLMKANGGDKKVVLTLPAAGCGFFAGDFRDGRATKAFITAIQTILGEKQDKLKNIALIQMEGSENPPVGLFNDSTHKLGAGANSQKIYENQFGETMMRFNKVQHYTQFNGLLQKPEFWGEEYKDCKLVKLVGWDHFSLPGNEGLEGRMSSDDAAMVASTNIGKVITSVEGKYEVQSGFKATNNKNWSQQQCNLSTQCGEIVVLSKDGTLKKLDEIDTLVQPEQKKINEIQLQAIADIDFDQIESDLKKLLRKSGSEEIFAEKLIEIVGKVITNSENLTPELKNELKTQYEQSLKDTFIQYSTEKDQKSFIDKIINWIKEVFGYGLAKEFSQEIKSCLGKEKTFQAMLESRKVRGRQDLQI